MQNHFNYATAPAAFGRAKVSWPAVAGRVGSGFGSRNFKHAEPGNHLTDASRLKNAGRPIEIRPFASGGSNTGRDAWVVGDNVLHGRSMEARAKGKTAEKQDLAAAKIIRTTITRLYKARFKAEGEKLTVCVVIAPSYFELSIERGSTKSAMALPREYIEKFPDDTVAQIAGFLGNIHTIFVENKTQIDTVKTITAAAALLSRVYPAERVEKALEDLAKRGVSAGTHELAKSEQRRDPVKVKAASRVMRTAQKRGPRGPRVKPDPRLPETAPEIYRERRRGEKRGRKKENIVQFLERVYAPWREILKRADLRRLDPTADRAVNNWINTGKRLPKGLLLTEYELNTERRVQRRASLREDAPAQP